MSKNKMRDFKAEDIYKLNLANEPQISPDGEIAAFVVQKWDKEKDRSITNIKMIDLDTGKLRTVTTGCYDRYPRFSPEGNKLAFISERSGNSAIWIIDLKGAVSFETAEAMAENIKNITSADYGIGITGIAGPTGGTKEKPVGLVYIGIAGKEKTRVYEYKLKGKRKQIKYLSSEFALKDLKYMLYKEGYHEKK